MYQSLYRKYRPKNFEQVVGQDIVVKTLIHTIEKSKISHAYLFTGPRGTGKTSIAKILAKTINCENQKNAIPCENCINCLQYNNKQSSDIIEIDAASNNGVDEIRELKNKISIVPTTGKYKIYIIDEVHMLTVGAFNALLKTLEEPPAHVIFILATTEPHKIPSTILSRCQRFDFKKHSIENIKNQLSYICSQENVEISAEALYELARISDGGMRDALSLLDQAISYAENKIEVNDIHDINGTLPQSQLEFLFLSLKNQNIQDVFKIIDEYDENGKNFIKITNEFILFLRNVLLALQTPKYLKEECENANYYIELSKKIDLDTLLTYLEIFNKGLSDLKVSNNPRLNLEIICIKLMNLQKKDTFITQQKDNEPLEYENGNSFPQKKSEKKSLVDDSLTECFMNSLVNAEYSKQMMILKNIRIENTLCMFDKKLFLQRKSQLDSLNQYILDPTYSKYASLILDGELKAAGGNYLIFVFSDSTDSDIYNENVLQLDELLKLIFKEKISSISVSSNEWEHIKYDFNHHVKEYKFIEEMNNHIEFLKKDNISSNIIENSFEDLVEYK